MDELATPLAVYAASRREGSWRPHVRQEYAESGYWESLYQEQQGNFDWYAAYNELGGIFEEFCPPSEDLPTLMVGCGNSAFSSELFQAGYRQITNIDISQAVVAKMSAKYKALGMRWQAMDATSMEFKDGDFGLVVEKGTLDGMMCGTTTTEVLAMLAEIYRVLAPGGILVLVSHNAKRMQLLNAAVAAHHAAAAPWELLEQRKCRLSAQAMLINILRSKLKGRPLSDAFKNPELLQEAAAESKIAMKRMAFQEVFRLYKAKKAREREAAGGPKETVEGDGAAAPEQEQSAEPWLQPYCWVYVLRKPQGS